MKIEKKYANHLHYADEDRFKKVSVFGTEIDLESDVEADEIIKCRCGYDGKASDIDTYNWRKKRSQHLYCPKCERRMSIIQRYRIWKKKGKTIGMKYKEWAKGNEQSSRAFMHNYSQFLKRINLWSYLKRRKEGPSLPDGWYAYRCVKCEKLSFYHKSNNPKGKEFKCKKCGFIVRTDLDGVN